MRGSPAIWQVNAQDLQNERLRCGLFECEVSDEHEVLQRVEASIWCVRTTYWLGAHRISLLVAQTGLSSAQCQDPVISHEECYQASFFFCCLDQR